MASGKKAKKSKGKTLALTDFLQETPGPLASQPIRKTSNWADEVDDYDGFESSSRNKVSNLVLPTAPKASRDFDDISDKVPKDPPYIAYLSNLPYDVEEEEIAMFFKNMNISNMRIPKDDRPGEMPKLKGFGYVEFEDRESFLQALVIPDTTLKNRRIRIEVAANADNNDRRRGRMDMGRDRGGEGRSEFSSDWRSGPRVESSDSDRRGGGGFSRDRENSNREFTRDGMRDSRENRDREFTRDNMRDSGFNRDRDSGFSRDRDSGFHRGDRDGGFGRSDRDGFRNRDQDDKPGAWRDAERPNRDSDRDRGFSRGFRDSDRGGRFDDRDGERRGGFGGRRYDNDRDRDGERNGGFTRSSNRGDKDERESEPSSESRQRPRLQLAPRTKPIESEAVKVEPAVPSASIFGDAKPVDTAQRERQIEEKLQKEQEERLTRDGSKDRREKGEERGERRNIERGRPPRKDDKDQSPARNRDLPSKNKHSDDESKEPPRSEHKSPDNRSTVEKPKREDKRDKHELPKLQEPEPPNFAASNKFAFLQTDDNSD